MWAWASTRPRHEEATLSVEHRRTGWRRQVGTDRADRVALDQQIEPRLTIDNEVADERSRGHGRVHFLVGGQGTAL